MTPYSAHVVMRMNLRYGRCAETTSVLSRRHSAVRAARNSDFGHLPQIEHFVDLILGKNLLPLHQITNQYVLLHRLLAELGGAGVADLRSQRSCESR